MVNANIGENVDYGRSVLVDRSKRASELTRLRNDIRLAEKQRDASAKFMSEPGVTLIIATHNGETRINGLLDSLVKQTIAPSRFEIVIVENGRRDGTEKLVESYRVAYPSYNFRYFWTREASAGGARNLGLRLASMSRLTFVDDDDQLEPSYIESALEVSTGNNVVVSPIVDLQPDGQRREDNALNRKIAKLRGGKHRVVDHPWLLGFNSCKLVPTWMVRELRYVEELKSGEDLVFWSQLLGRKGLEAVVASGLSGNAYLRGLRDDSVSRRTLTRDFGVSQRLECIRELGRISEKFDKPALNAMHSLASAQAGFVSRYIAENPGVEDSVYSEISHAVPTRFPWEILNKGKARDLAFLYCFAPFSDTSAVVASKAVAERARIVDVITNDMSKVRAVDTAVSSLADRWIDQRIQIDATASFSDWNLISEFAEKAVSKAETLNANKSEYRSLYSRALWVGSHVAASLFKLRHWNVEWTAEFSDPLRRDAEGRMRVGALTDNLVAKRLFSGIASRGFGDVRVDSLFDLVEIAAFVLADRLVFTNANQLEYMLSLPGVEQMREVIASKAIVREHPTPPEESYDAVESYYDAPGGFINLAYFGNFYPNRGIDDMCLALANSSEQVRRKVRFHVFSNQVEQVSEVARRLGVGANVHSNPYLPYMEFLNASKKFDVLIVNDVQRGPLMPINPFLPSKLSDYRGSGSAIWAIVDHGSPMSGMDFEYKSSVGNVPDMVKVLSNINASFLV